MRKITLRSSPLSGKKLESISINSLTRQSFSGYLENDFFARLVPKLDCAKVSSCRNLLLIFSRLFANQIILTNFDSGIGAIQCNIKINREII
jgi:hypothetical protein